MQTITLDSNVWKDLLFINWLQSNTSVHEVHICPIIVYLETRIWYDMKKLSKADFHEDLKKLKTQVVLFNETHAETVTDITRRTRISFQHHARDLMIGAIVIEKKSLLITQNTRHFSWLPEPQRTTPQDYVQAAVFKSD